MLTHRKTRVAVSALALGVMLASVLARSAMRWTLGRYLGLVAAFAIGVALAAPGPVQAATLNPGSPKAVGSSADGPGQATVVNEKCNKKKKTCQRALSIAKAGDGAGRVTSTPAGISCGDTCSADFPDGTLVTLTPAADPGSTFSGFSGGGCSGTGPCEVTMTSAQSVTATFTLAQQPQHLLTVTVVGTGNVTSSPGAIDCPGAAGAGQVGTCLQDFDEGQVVTLTATPDPGSTFAGFSGGGCSGTGPCEVTMTSAQSVTATFTTP